MVLSICWLVILTLKEGGKMNYSRMLELAKMNEDQLLDILIRNTTNNVGVDENLYILRNLV